ncbi:MAG: fructose-bisphosphate aldolase, partial [Candidatus Heimdallarchaeota archaeon]
HIAAQMGADIIKVKPPTKNIGLEVSKPSYENIPKDTLTDRIQHIMDSAFNGKRITIFSGGVSKSIDDVIEDVKSIKNGGGHGSIMGRNLFQRNKDDAMHLLNKVIDIYKN